MAGVPMIDFLIPQLAIVSSAASLGFTIYRVWKEAKAHRQEAIVSTYWGYEQGHRQKDDSRIREFLSGEVERGRGNLRTAVDLLVKEKKTSAVGPIRECLDELDLLLNEVRLGPTQKAVIFLDKKGKIDQAVVDKLRSMDTEVIHRLSVIAEASKRLSQLIVDGSQVDITTEFRRMRLYIQQTREQYKQRVAIFEAS